MAICCFCVESKAVGPGCADLILNTNLNANGTILGGVKRSQLRHSLSKGYGLCQPTTFSRQIVKESEYFE